MVTFRFHPWVTSEQVDTTLQGVEFGLSNAQSQELPAAYIRWADDSERILTNITSSEHIQRFVHTPRYWSILQRTQELPGEGKRVVLAEIEDRLRVIRSMQEERRRQRQTWSGQVINLVLDTSVIVQSDAPFETFDWATALSSQNVRVVVPLVVLDELDGLKRTGKADVATAARVAVREIQQRISPPDLRGRLEWPGGVLQVLPEGMDHSRLDSNDWEILDRAAYLSTVAEGPVRLATYDIGMRTRAMVMGVELALPLPKERENPPPRTTKAKPDTS